jgi:hypothetical protein
MLLFAGPTCAASRFQIARGSVAATLPQAAPRNIRGADHRLTVGQQVYLVPAHRGSGRRDAVMRGGNAGNNAALAWFYGQTSRSVPAASRETDAAKWREPEGEEVPW